MDVDGDVESGHMGGEEMNSLDQVVPLMDPVGETSSEHYELQKGIGNWRPSTGVCWDHVSTYDLSSEVVGFNLEDEKIEEYIHLVSFKYLLSNVLRPHKVFIYFFWFIGSFIEILDCKKSLRKLRKLLPS